MATLAPNSHDTCIDGGPPAGPSVLSNPDAERLVLQSRFGEKPARGSNP
jgi:hypothetical protein